LFWVAESLVHAHVFDESHFELLPSEPNELWMRALIAWLFVAFGALGDRQIAALERTRRERERLQQRLEASLAKVLSGFLPICSSCKRIRGSDDEWMRVAAYLEERTEAHFTHSLCESCASRLYPDET
jgi:hypothetical protein